MDINLIKKLDRSSQSVHSVKCVNKIGFCQMAYVKHVNKRLITAKNVIRKDNVLNVKTIIN